MPHLTSICGLRFQWIQLYSAHDLWMQDGAGALTARVCPTRAVAATLDSHTRCHAISTQSLCHTVSVRTRTIWPTPARPTSVRSPAAAATLPAPSTARPRPVPRAQCAEPWNLSAPATPHWRRLAPVCRYANGRFWHAPGTQLRAHALRTAAVRCSH